MSKKQDQKTAKAKVEEKPQHKEPERSPNEEALEKFKALFLKADKKKSGKININEFKDLMKQNFEDVDPEVVAGISQVADGYGQITLDGYLSFMRTNFLDTEEEDVIRAFRVFDKDNNGYLTCAEFKHILTNLGDKFSEDEVEEVFREANLKGDGKLNYVDFVEFWKAK